MLYDSLYIDYGYNYEKDLPLVDYPWPFLIWLYSSK